jgi:DNA-binding transcriptional regulator LsrR (DeoR family)
LRKIGQACGWKSVAYGVEHKAHERINNEAAATAARSVGDFYGRFFRHDAVQGLAMHHRVIPLDIKLNPYRARLRMAIAICESINRLSI